ncbi:MAG: flagellar biosynthetic protein FliO, partial [Spirochaetota bacterium]
LFLGLAVALYAQDTGGLLDEAAIPVQLGGGNPAPEGEQEAITPPANLVSPSLYLRIFLILGFLIALIYVSLKFLRRLSLQKPRLPGSGGGIRVLGTQALYADRMIHVVEVGGECYLLGSSTGGVQLLDHYTDTEIKDRVILEVTAADTAGGGTDFLRLLRNRLQGGNGEAREAVSPDTRSYRERLRSSVQNLKGGDKS